VPQGLWNPCCHEAEFCAHRSVGRASLPAMDASAGERYQSGVAERYYRRRLPHWRDDCATYFVTWRLAEAQPDLGSSERDLVASALKRFEGQRYQLMTFVVMNDHVHVLLNTMEPCRLEDLVHSWKSFTANRMQRDHGRRGRVWQDEYFDRIVRDEKEFEQKFKYIQGNPWSRWPDLETYRWVWPVDG
jgi:REP-associated tyrosine transposase